MPSIDVSGLGGFIREQRDQAQMSLRQLSKAADVSNPYLSQVERGLRRPSAEILNRIAQGLRISAETLYVQAGILDHREGDVAVTTKPRAMPLARSAAAKNTPSSSAVASGCVDLRNVQRRLSPS